MRNGLTFPTEILIYLCFKMSLLKRIGYFLIGLSFGIVFLTFFLKNKKAEFCYLPNCRVLKNIRSKSFKVETETQKVLDLNHIELSDINTLLENAEVDFSKSNTKSEPCKTYTIEAVWSEKPVVLKIKNCPDEAVLENFTVNQTN